ncbi:MAG: MaoC/PaaZ C-terminal domain-containing protein, partial [Candidatus Hydrogenedentota bacterium]
MATREVDINDVPNMVGEELGSSEWHEVTQEDIQKFAEATGDFQWIHLDVERAKKESPYGCTIAHGY